jgi:hypothetical protein
MVILGAGASFDSSPDYPAPLDHARRPPLADNLFERREAFNQARAEFAEINEIIPELLPRPGRSIEQSLQRLNEEVATNPARIKQLTAVRYYLQEVFRTLVPQWLGDIGGVTNYQALLGQILHYRTNGEPVCLVTFNYDTLLESALERYGLTFTVPNDYVTHDDFKLFKLHGSANWGRSILGGPPQIAGRAVTDPWAKPHDIIEHAASLNISNNYVVTGTGAGYKGAPLYPAIAIPMLNKQEFECPREHVHMLTQMLPRVRKILTVGWKANEQHFLNLLGNLPAIRIATIAGTDTEAQEILEKLRSLGMPILDTGWFVNFSDTVARRRLDPLLAS